MDEYGFTDIRIHIGDIWRKEKKHRINTGDCFLLRLTRKSGHFRTEMKAKKGRFVAFDKNWSNFSLGKQRQHAVRLTEPFPSYANHAVYCFPSRHDRGLFLPCAGAMSKVKRAMFGYYLGVYGVFYLSLDTKNIKLCRFVCHYVMRLTLNLTRGATIGLNEASFSC